MALANSHARDYLDYYCGLSNSPGFAVLLKGPWGSGKTWFIEKYKERLKKNNFRCLYISLYGLASVTEIDEKFFQMLHPIMSSKGMAITGIILKGLLKGALKIDLTGDGKDDGTWNIQIPSIDLPHELDDIDSSILIFDDLERCNIDPSTLLGYINFFVEHQGLKVILVANEEQLLKKNEYKAIKEKLIGKTFSIFPDFEDSLKVFSGQIQNDVAREFLLKNCNEIKDLYDKLDYKNLRSLNQIILDFERIFEALPTKVRNHAEALKEILKFLVVFTIEIRRGEILPQSIHKLQEEYSSTLSEKFSSRSSTKSNEKSGNKKSLQEILAMDDFFVSHVPFPSLRWWDTFLDQGIVDAKELDQSILSSKYFQDESTPDWIKLWHCSDLSDNEFDELVEKIKGEYSNRDYTDIGIIKHIFGLFLVFSDARLYDKSKREILEDSKKYIDDLKETSRLEPLPHYIALPAAIGHMLGGYRNLGFQGKEFEEFKEFCDYIREARKVAYLEKMPELARNLLDVMQNNIFRFHRMICFDSSPHQDEPEERYHETPILNHVSTTAFMEAFMAMKNEDRQHVFWSISERYKYEHINQKLFEEIAWLQSIQALLLQEASRRQGKISSFNLDSLNKGYLKEAIEKLISSKEASEAS